MNEIKIGKLPTYYITGYTLNSISKLFQGGNMVVVLGWKSGL